ncbi:hypothetical protein ACFLQ5_00150 [Bacteroidota bacterium]
MKHISLICISVFITVLSFGQTLNLQSGLSVSRIYTDGENIQVQRYNALFYGNTVFLGLDYLNEKYINLSGNIGFIRKGGNIESSDSINYPGQVSFDYLSINSMFEFKYPISSNILPFMSLGLRYDFLLNINRENNHFWKYNVVKSNSYGLLVGCGVKYDFSKLQIGLRSDYYYNFNDLAKFHFPANNNDDALINTFTFNLIIGYKIK